MRRSFYTLSNSKDLIMAEASVELLIYMVQKVLDNQRESRTEIQEIEERLNRLESEITNLYVLFAEHKSTH